MIYRKKTHKDVTDPRILEIWEGVKAEAKMLYPYYFEGCEPEFYQDNSYRNLGRCFQSFRNPSEKNVDKIRHSKCIITISSNLKQDYDQIRKTLCHEFGHFVAPKEDHGYLWKVRTNKIGERWGLKAERLTDNQTFNSAAEQARKEKNKSEYKYRAYCPKCGAEWKYKTQCKVVKSPERWRCSQCYSPLKSETI